MNGSSKAALLAQALGMAYAAGISPYATVAVLGIAHHLGWVGDLPGALDVVGSPWVIGVASALYLVEFLATLIPGVASLWETVQTFIRPPLAALLAGATVWGNGALAAIAVPLGAALGLTTHGTKLGMRYAIDTSPEPVSNGASNVAELGIVSALVVAIWQHPIIALALALVLLVLLLMLVRMVWVGIGRAIKRLFRGRQTAGTGPPGHQP
ncbi:MAG TPA: DUF4126 domain-containing protein [Gemmatimonadaceae bacterium]|nr:DUF4126 domain-containing protein [Gemmatimonadaceae bacterium]